MLGNGAPENNGAMAMRPLYSEGGKFQQNTLLAMHLAPARLSELKTQHLVNILLALSALVYFAVQIVCFVINQFENECYGVEELKAAATTLNKEQKELVEECESKTGAWADKSFHMLEFWATFLFNIVDILALMYSPKNLQTVFCSPTLLKVLVFMNICTSLISAMLITINMPLFEVWAHEIEYIDEVMLATVDIIILVSLIRKVRGGSRRQKCDVASNALIVIIALAVALAQFCIFNFMGWEEGDFPKGEPVGEKHSHDLEFVFGTISSFITFWFTMDNALEADRKSKALYRGDLGKLGMEDMDTEVNEGDGLQTSADEEDATESDE
jgi:hypothetical protein